PFHYEGSCARREVNGCTSNPIDRPSTSPHLCRMTKLLSTLGWALAAVTGAGCIAYIALSRGETISAAWVVTAAVCTYAIAYRFYSKMIAANIFALNATRATPA